MRRNVPHLAMSNIVWENPGLTDEQTDCQICKPKDHWDNRPARQIRFQGGYTKSHALEHWSCSKMYCFKYKNRMLYANVLSLSKELTVLIRSLTNSSNLYEQLIKSPQMMNGRYVLLNAEKDGRCSIQTKMKTRSTKRLVSKVFTDWRMQEIHYLYPYKPADYSIVGLSCLAV